jgi:monovalent cation:H+ antiporter-2, CPA2 family
VVAVSDLLTALSAIFIVAGVLLVLANHYSLSTVPFLILAGVIAGFFIETVVLLELAQWGIAFLVFVFGVELDLSSIRTLARDVEIATGIQLGAVGALGFGAGLAFGFDPLNALYLSIAAALSSTSSAPASSRRRSARTSSTAASPTRRTSSRTWWRSC